MGAAVRTIFAEPDAVHVRSQLGEVAGMLAPQFPQVATMLKDAAEDLLAFTAFPLAHWRKLWWTNPLERVNGEIKGRTNVVGIFPNHAVVRLVTAVCVETHDEWAVAERRYLSEDSMAKMEPSANKAIEDTPITTSKTVTSTITPATLTYTTRAIASETGLVDDSGVCGDIPSAHEWSHAAMEKQSVR